MNVLYGHLDRMDVACIQRFAEWFALHLSNFDFKWEWADWENAAEAVATPQQGVFVREVLAHCIRLSYYEKIAKLIPDSMKTLLPLDPTPNFKYQDNCEFAFNHLCCLLPDLTRPPFGVLPAQ